MFCPVGYRSAAELWTEYKARRLEIIYDSVVADYNDPSIDTALVRGSPLDICEHSFLKTLCALGVYLTSPAGQVVRVHIALEDGVASVFSVLGPQASAWHGALAFIESDNPNFEEIFKGTQFEDWPHKATDTHSWAREYRGLSERSKAFRHQNDLGLKHHCLPNHFIRPAYMIASEIPPWARNDSGGPTVAPVLEHYAGWSVCIDETAYSGAWQDYLSGRKQIFGEHTTTAQKSLPGRPKLERALAAFAAMKYDKGDLSWEQVARKIEKETGEKPSPKTLRNWRDTHRSP